MQTTVTERGQISIPSLIRKKYHLKPGMGIEWLIREEGIFLMPVPSDPISAFKSKSKGETEALLKARARDRKRENQR